MEVSKLEIGVICGNFDVIHPGYIQLFEEMNKKCTNQYILLHDNPQIQRPEKLKSINFEQSPSHNNFIEHSS